VPAEAVRGGVWVDGDERTAMRLNLESRLAQRVLWPLADGPYRDEHDLYDLARRVPWPTGSRPSRRCAWTCRRSARRCRA
jgi:putative N6-adenine-specific DNA methylase